MKNKRLFLVLPAAALVFAFILTGCPEPENPSTGPNHTHEWGDWGATTLEGTEQRTCKVNSAHIEQRLTGTERFTFTADTATTYSVRKGDVTSGDVVIPAYYRPDNSIGYLPVTAIGSNAFYQCLHIDSINIPETITTIGNNAFSYCGLDSLIIPASVTSIGSGAFSYSYIDSITIPSSVTEVGSGAFYYWNEWQIINVPFDDEKAADDAWGAGWRSGCYAIIIGKITYDGTPGLEFELIDNGTAYSVSAGKAKRGEVRIPSSYNGKPVTEISSGNQQLDDNTYTYSGAFTGCTGITGITIPASVTSIGWGAFIGCTGLTSITIPASVTSMGGSAFSGCTNLTNITVAASNPNYASQNGILYNKAKTEIIWVPLGISGNVTIPQGVTYIYSSDFNGRTGLTGITVAANNPNYSSQDGILYNKAKTEIICVPLGISGNITIPASVTSISSTSIGSAFQNCTGLTDITFTAGSQLQTIGSNAFYGCTGLTSITIPASVTSISGQAFYNCTSLTSVTFTAGSQLQTIGFHAFYGCTGLTSITIPASVTTIESGAFSGCTGLTSITIPASVTTIESGAFSGCTGLTSITIPAGVTSIGGSAFNGCTGLTSITIPAGVKSIGGSAFNGCTGLTSVTIPDSVTSIGASAFSGCTGLTSITIPAGVTSIGGGAFGGCTGLTSITIPAGVTSIGSNAFNGWTSSQTINIQGKANQAAADAAWRVSLENWRDGCNAQINYLGQ